MVRFVYHVSPNTSEAMELEARPLAEKPFREQLKALIRFARRNIKRMDEEDIEAKGAILLTAATGRSFAPVEATEPDTKAIDHCKDVIRQMCAGIDCEFNIHLLF